MNTRFRRDINDPTIMEDDSLEFNDEASEKPKYYDSYCIWIEWCKENTLTEKEAFNLFRDEMIDLTHTDEEISDMWSDFHSV